MKLREFLTSEDIESMIQSQELTADHQHLDMEIEAVRVGKNGDKSALVDGYWYHRGHGFSEEDLMDRSSNFIESTRLIEGSDWTSEN